MSLTFTAFYLKPTGPWRLGNPGVGMESSGVIGHSDTLFSAFCHAWLATGEFEALKTELASPAFKISSLFPYAKLEKPLHVFSRPLVDLHDPLQQTKRKLLKNAEFVTEGILRHLQYKHELPNDWNFLMGTKIVATHQEACACSIALEEKNLWRHDHQTLIPRVVVDRQTNTSNIYHVARLLFHERGGFFFLFQGDDTWRGRVHRALLTLQYQGIGSERTYGFGLFKLEGHATVTFASPGQPNGYFLFSLFAPQQTEIQSTLGGKALYTLLRRSGYVDSPISRSHRRMQVYMVAEGAVLPKEPQGQVVDVKPRFKDHKAIPLYLKNDKGEFLHPVWRFGRALSLPAYVDWSYYE